jgi:hypothetical protein
MPLWDITPEMITKSDTLRIKTDKPTRDFKLKKGETLDTLIVQAKKLVEEKLGKYKDTSKCVIEPEVLVRFFEETPDEGVIGIDTETTGLNTLTDTLVGISVCNGKEALYIPINHISAISGRLKNQIAPEKIKEIFGNVFKTRKFKWVRER